MRRSQRSMNLAADWGLHGAVATGNVHSVRELLQAGLDINEEDEFGSTPLHRAAWQEDTEIATLLLDHCADVCARRHDGKSAVDLAELRHASSGDEMPAGLSGEPACLSDAASAVASLLQEDSSSHGHWESYLPTNQGPSEEGDRCHELNSSTISSFTSVSTCASDQDLGPRLAATSPKATMELKRKQGDFRAPAALGALKLPGTLE
mmetsp:Transcript_82360/g.236648  ORF Transcript_82360/g.236648 Transcript_82360/m.236648 type:complete len:207 (+) Transcript_82360:107-727(+)